MLASGIVVGGGLVAVAVSDGKGRELVRREKSLWNGEFSPDGRFFAFSEGLPALFTAKTFVVPLQGGEPRLISEDASLLGWTRDGRYLVVSSKRSGSAALWLLPLKDGQPSGDPVLVRNGAFMSGGVFANGALGYGSINTGSTGASLATLDADGHLSPWKSLDLKITGNNGVGRFNWSPDGTRTQSSLNLAGPNGWAASHRPNRHSISSNARKESRPLRGWRISGQMRLSVWSTNETWISALYADQRVETSVLAQGSRKFFDVRQRPRQQVDLLRRPRRHRKGEPVSHPLIWRAT